MLKLESSYGIKIRWLHCDFCDNIYKYYRQTNICSGWQARKVRHKAKEDGWIRKKKKDVCTRCHNFI